MSQSVSPSVGKPVSPWATFRPVLFLVLVLVNVGMLIASFPRIKSDISNLMTPDTTVYWRGSYDLSPDGTLVVWGVKADDGQYHLLGRCTNPLDEARDGDPMRYRKWACESVWLNQAYRLLNDSVASDTDYRYQGFKVTYHPPGDAVTDTVTAVYYRPRVIVLWSDGHWVK